MDAIDVKLDNFQGGGGGMPSCAPSPPLNAKLQCGLVEL